MAFSYKRGGLFETGRNILVGAFALAGIGLFVAAARGETVRTIDDQTTSGTLRGFESGSLLLDVKQGKPPQKFPLAEVAEVVLRPVIGRNQSGGATGNPLNLFGALFGGNSDASDDDQGETRVVVRRGRRIAVAVNPTTTAPSTGPVAAQPAKPATKRLWNLWTVEFSSGDSVTASLDHWAGDRVRLGLDGIGGRAMEVPVDRVGAIWSASSELVQKAKGLNSTTAGQDVVFVEKDGDVKSVAGVATGIDGGYLKFKFESQDHGIKLEHLVGLLLSQREIAPEKSLYETFTLVNGDTLSGRIESIRKNAPKAAAIVRRRRGFPAA